MNLIHMLRITTLVFLVVLSVQPLTGQTTTTTITATDRFAYGANIGWMDACADTDNGVVIGEYVCSGYLYAANVGWISLGSGAPANQIQYQNNSARDFGVNHVGQGNLRGYAYGANIGWVDFEATGGPRVDLVTGDLSGYAWSANCGWISLSNSVAFVQTGRIQPARLAANGLPVPWVLENFGTVSVDPTADLDGDGMNNSQEYVAGTNPNDAASVLKIIHFTRGTSSPSRTILRWTSVPTRFYAVEQCAGLGTGQWFELVAWPWPGADNVGFDESSDSHFYRVRASLPALLN